MSNGEQTSDHASPATLAFEEFSSAFDRLLKTVADGGLDHFDDGQLLKFMQQHEQLRNRTSLLDHHLVTAVVERDIADRHCQGSPAQLLRSRLLISKAEARRRVHAAAAVGERRSQLGQPLEPVRPVLAAAQATGQVGAEQAAIVVHALNSVTGRGLDQQAIDDGEELLAGFAATFAPEDLRTLARGVVDAIDPDGKLPDEVVHDRRSFALSPAGEHAWRCTGLLTGEVGAQLQAFLDAHARPHTSVPDLPKGPGTVDERTRAQRMHDALGDLAARGLREGDTTHTTTGAPTIIITINADDLIQPAEPETQTETEDAGEDAGDDAGEDAADQESDRGTATAADAFCRPRPRRWKLGTGHGYTTSGVRMSVAEIAALASEAEIIPAWMSHTGEILALGRTKRCASRSQTLALIARDVGCSFPGCDKPPEWCERHHILSWLLDHDTDIDNLTLLCRYHHHNFEMRGWTCRLNHDGLPEWTPPHWIDHAQTPLINHRILAKLSRCSNRRRTLRSH